MACAPCEARRAQLESEALAAMAALREGQPAQAVRHAIIAGSTAMIGFAEMVGLKSTET